MKIEQTEHRYLVITPEGDHYCVTATEAVVLAGVPKWNALRPAQTVRKMEPGDEMSVGNHCSIFCITGKDTTLEFKL